MKKLFFIGLFLIGTLFNIHLSQAAEILVIQSYHKEFPWDQDYTRAIKDRLGNKHKLTFVHMDTKRLPKSKFAEQANMVWDKYRSLKPDYVILGDDNALKYLGRRFGETKTPVVFLGINNKPEAYFDNGKIPENITGVLERPLLVRNIYYLKQMMPKLSKVLMLFDGGPSSKAAFNTNTTKSQQISGIKYDVVFTSKQKVWHEAVKKAKKAGYDAIFIGPFYSLRDENDKHVPSSEMLSWTSQNAEIPLFSFWTFAAGKGKVAGGIMMDGYEQGSEASSLMDKITRGIKPSIIQGKKGLFYYSKSELARWGLKLPKDIVAQTTFVE